MHPLISCKLFTKGGDEVCGIKDYRGGIGDQNGGIRDHKPWNQGSQAMGSGLAVFLRDQTSGCTTTNHRIDWDSAECVIYSTDYYQRLTLESWFTNLEQTPLNQCQQLPAPYKRLINDTKTDKQ